MAREPEDGGNRSANWHWISLIGLAFVAGALLGANDLEPARFLSRGLDSTRQLVNEVTQTKPAKLYPIRHTGNGVTVHDSARAQPGLTLVQGVLPGGPQVRVVDMAGHEIHRWKVDLFEIWPDPEHIVPADNIAKSRFNYHTQGFVALGDGSLVVNISEHGTARLDRCGKVLWTVDRMTHHSVTRTRDGGYWIHAHRPITEVDAALLPAGTDREWIATELAGGWKNFENTILKVSSAGRVEKEFSVLRAIVDARLEDALYDGFAADILDPTHINDIEVVTPALAQRINGVAAGDLLVSVRNMHMLVILDSETGAVNWHQRGPWVRQHDPDIMPDGRIEVYNNRAIGSGRFVDESRILRFDPATGESRVLHPLGKEDKFASGIMGTHQRLINGNILITESVAGRVFEATPDGEVVWEYVLAYDAEDAALIEEAARVPEGYFDVKTWSCDP